MNKHTSVSNPRPLSPDATHLIELKNPGDLRLRFTRGGSLVSIHHGATLINQVVSYMTEDGLMRLAAREKKAGGSTSVISLIGPNAPSVCFQAEENTLSWKGSAKGMEYEVLAWLHPSHPAWFWSVRLGNGRIKPLTLDLVYGQDLGLADEGAVRNNEAYVSQYIDHYPVAADSVGTAILSRQNLAQDGGNHPWIAQGCLEGAAAFSTDGYQFFGVEHRFSGKPAAWRLPKLPSERKQYEAAYIGLQTHEIQLQPGEERTVHFFAWFEPHHPKPSSRADLQNVLRQVKEIQPPSFCSRWQLPPNSAWRSLFTENPVEAGEALHPEDLDALFPEPWRNVEKENGELLSFFYGNCRHVVTGRKEALTERPHGHILRSGSGLWPGDGILGTTVYAAGVFNSQVYVGNTNMGRYLSVVRNPLNVLRAGGQRVFVRAGNQRWQQLGIPSAFEMGLGHARWIYRQGDDLIEARTSCWSGRSAVSLELRVLRGAPREFLVTHLLMAGTNELDDTGQWMPCKDEGWIGCTPAPESPLAQRKPDAGLLILIDEPGNLARTGGDELLFKDGISRSAPFAVLQTRKVASCTVVIAGCVPDRFSELATDLRADLAHAESPMLSPADGLPLAGVKFSSPADDDAGRINEILPWFAHHAMIHLTAPHGLEQYGGAAWGVRDVCQGPVEWLLAAGAFAPVWRILIAIFERQYQGTGEWPQWFMHPPFADIQQTHSHGDIPFWPAKALADYIEASGDFGILEETAPYTDPETFRPTQHRESLLLHIDRIVAHYKARCLPGTALISYGDGDWDDTLQPADPYLRSIMTSSWTVGLAFQTFQAWREIYRRAGQTERENEIAELLENIQCNFRMALMIDGIVAGFAAFENGRFHPLLHPRDAVTGIRYRLIPMTRAILAELFTPEEARRHVDAIRDSLLFPDGVRLMSDPVEYCGGIEKIFRRAESAASFGREIGLQYVHAHIRYAEAMARMGDADALWQALLVINPVGIRNSVPHAALRQSNAYFSSSDGDFPDRYIAGEEFARLRDGSVSVKGGWRIYSSGPGIYLNKVVTCLLGWRRSFGDVVIDPVMPKCLDGLRVEWNRDGKKLILVYSVRHRNHTPSCIRINGKTMEPLRPENNPYRSGGVRIAEAVLDRALDQAKNLVEIDL